MTLERIRRRAAQSDDRTADAETDATSGEDADATPRNGSGDLDSSGSRLGILKRTVGVALVVATTVVAARRLRRRRGE